VTEFELCAWSDAAFVMSSPHDKELSSHVCCILHKGRPLSVVQGARGADASTEDAEESAAGPEAMAAAEAAREAGMRARNQGRRNFNPRTMEALVEDMIEQAYAGDGLEVSVRSVCDPGAHDGVYISIADSTFIFGVSLDQQHT